MIFFGLLVTNSPNLLINFSIIPILEIAFELGSHLINEINTGNKVSDKIQAQQIPKASTIPYPFMPFKGEKIKVRKAKAVVMEVRDIGIVKCSMVLWIAILVFLIFLNSLKNLPTTCTPSELAIVNKTIGIEV